MLKKFVDMAFKEGLWKGKKEIMLESNSPRVAWQEEKVFSNKTDFNSQSRKRVFPTNDDGVRVYRKQ